MPLSIAKCLAQGTEGLTTHGVPNPRLDAEVLLAHALGFSRAELYTRLRDALSEQDSSRFQQLIQRRQQREPLQYIIGVQEFWSLEFRVTPDVLIPRPETELVVETALHLIKKRQKAKGKNQKAKVETLHLDSGLLILAPQLPAPTIRNPQPAFRILDVGTGSGCLAIALAKELPDVELWAIDISTAALAVAQENARRHGVTDRMHFLCGDLFAPLQDLDLAFDLIVANPPYIAQGDLLNLQPEVQRWEPHLALDGGIDGLNFYRRLLQESPRYLQTGGWLVMEIGHEQEQAVLQLAQQQQTLSNSTGLLDYAGRERVILTQKKPEAQAQK